MVAKLRRGETQGERKEAGEELSTEQALPAASEVWRSIGSNDPFSTSASIAGGGKKNPTRKLDKTAHTYTQLCRTQR